MKSREIRQRFLDFFKERTHAIVPSAPMVIKNDPTLMFTNAGMNQFKDYFLGNEKAPYNRAADTQKCLRVSGKHNDLEEVGVDTYHHTMFEMLGNWSFGDYFKQEAIDWAWELLTEVYGLPKDKLYATVFEGAKEDGLTLDTEAQDLWRKYLPEEHILMGNKKDNFWEMGDTGPCGPCSELHIDLRSDEEIAAKPGRELVNRDHPQVVEIWNLVFIQFNRKADGSLEKLPAAHVDTGMGFERLAMAIQQKASNYDTDVFQPAIQFIAKAAGKTYGQDEKTDIAIRVIADHVRAISFAIADGQLPSNNKAGYVIRRILRRAVRYGFNFLGFQAPFIYQLVDILAEQFDGVFPELTSQKDFIKKVIEKEEEAFLHTLANGLQILEQVMATNQGQKTIQGQTAFELYDRYGFPLDLTQLIAREHGYAVDQAGFDAAMAEQKARSRQDAATAKGDWITVHEGDEVEFVGYDALECHSRILRYREVEQKKSKIYQIVLEQTPFYGESGGQVGDKGYLESEEGKVEVFDTQKENNLIIHYAKKLPQDLEGIFRCVVSQTRRTLTENNHTATHLLHSALRHVLGDHVQQKGSLVSDEVLRFDFSHFDKMSDEEIRQVEQIVNERIRQNIALDEQRNVPIAQAKQMGATALFGEKYGDFVRVITFDPEYSVELCGGTHVPQTGQIGFFRITSESSVAAGVRRIEAVTAIRAEQLSLHEHDQITQAKALLNHPKDLTKAVEALVAERTKLQKDLEKAENKLLQSLKEELLTQFEEVNGIPFLAKQIEVGSTEALRQLCFELRQKKENLFVVFGAVINDKPQLAVMLSDSLVEQGHDAGKIVKALAKHIQGGGGGQPFFATAGGKKVEGIAEAIGEAKDYLGKAGERI